MRQAARAPRATESSTDSKAFCQASSSNESSGPAGGPPVFVTRMSRPPKAAAADSTSWAGPCARAEVDALAGDLGALARDRLRLVHRGGELGVVSPAHHHVHALARERAGDCLADAVAGGHHGRPAAHEIEIHGRDATRAEGPR